MTDEIITPLTDLLVGFLPPTESVLERIGGVPTFIVVPQGASVEDEGPIFLDVHGGALIVGDGDVTP